MNKDTQSWSNSNLTEMEELLQKVQRLERDNAALRRLIDDPNAMHSHYLRECNGWEVWQAERIRQFQDASEQLEQLERENAVLREDKEALDWLDQNAETVFFKFKSDNFRLNIRESFRTARAKEAKP